MELVHSIVDGIVNIKYADVCDVAALRIHFGPATWGIGTPIPGGIHGRLSNGTVGDMMGTAIPFRVNHYTWGSTHVIAINAQYGPRAFMRVYAERIPGTFTPIQHLLNVPNIPRNDEGFHHNNDVNQWYRFDGFFICYLNRRLSVRPTSVLDLLIVNPACRPVGPTYPIGTININRIFISAPPEYAALFPNNVNIQYGVDELNPGPITWIYINNCTITLPPCQVRLPLPTSMTPEYFEEYVEVELRTDFVTHSHTPVHIHTNIANARIIDSFRVELRRMEHAIHMLQRSHDAQYLMETVSGSTSSDGSVPSDSDSE